jgi:peptidyl-prolyl cis-trans isomerase C
MNPAAPHPSETGFEPRRIEVETLPPGRLRSALKRLAAEPLLHFFILSTVLWGIHAHLQARSQLSLITVSKALTAQLTEHYRQQYGASPTPRQLDALIDSAITEEMSYRQAIKLGLDQNDEIVRRRLIQKYEFLQQDLATPRDPTQAAAQDFYDHHLERYAVPERLTFTHVYFSPDRRGDVGARDAAATLATALSARGITRAANEGDTYPGPTDFVGVTAEEMARVFGRDGLSQEIGAAPIGHWSSPLRSGFGWHIVYVAERTPARQARLDEVRDRVTEDFLEVGRARRKAEASAVLRSQFEVVHE